MKIQFKAKFKEPFIKFPNSFERHHIVRETNDRSRLEKYYNSDLFMTMLQVRVNKELRLPLGQYVIVEDLPECVTVEKGFMCTVTIALGVE